ncbi:MAG TPA: hypothetical protein VJ978_10855, partial [Nitriliruptoraceae bacterium]|nr:hypothetical protein [Nitriliruptoraceae bacterium]
MTPGDGQDADNDAGVDERRGGAPGRPAPPPRATRHRYHAFDGQDPFGSRLDARDLLDRIGDDLLQGFSGQESLQRLLDEGFDGVAGLDELRRRIAARTRMAREATDTAAGRMLAELDAELDAIIDLERDARSQEDDPLAAMELDMLPRDPAGRMAALSQQTLRSPEARQRLAALQERVTRDLLDAQMAQLTAGMAAVTPDDLARTREMLTDLNELVAQRDRGEEPDLDAFLDTWGEFFPERPETLDELLASLAARMAAMSRLLASLSPEQRRQLLDLQRQLLDDPDLQFEMMQLEDALRDLAPNLPWDQPGSGQAGFGGPGDEWDPF